jgi:transposase
MCCMRFTISASYRKEVEHLLKTAQRLGPLRQVKYLLAILAVLDGQSCAQVALVLRVHEKTVATWVHRFCCYGSQGAPRTKPTGRPSKLTPTQKAALATLLEEGPGQAGFRGACWRSPMIQPLIYARFGVYSNVFYHCPVAQELRLQLSDSGLRLGSSRCKPAASVAYQNVAPDAAQGASPESPAVVWRCSQLPAGGHAHVDVGAAWAATDGQNIGPAARL